MLVTQTDKLLMSKLLSLEEYGYFSLAVLVANGVLMISSPITKSVLPRLARLEAEGQDKKMLKLYSQTTQLITVVAGSASIMLVVFAKPIFVGLDWRKKIVEIAAPVMQFYAAGFGILAVAAIPYYLQYALGKLKLHVAGSALYIILHFSVALVCQKTYGMIGAGYAWFSMNLFYLLFWTALVHVTYVPKLHLKWLTNDVLKLIILQKLVALGLSNLIIQTNRLLMLLELSVFGVLVIMAAVSLSKQMRGTIINFGAIMRNLRTEQEIISKVKSIIQILLSVFCFAYNHEDTIEDALDGFLMQQTNFPLFIIVHDDAQQIERHISLENTTSPYRQIIKTISLRKPILK